MSTKPIIKKESDEIADDLKATMSLETLKDSDGGKLLIEGLVSDIVSALDVLCGTFADPDTTHIMLVALAAKMKERLDLVRVLTSSKANRETYQKLLKDALAAEKENPLEQDPS